MNTPLIDLAPKLFTTVREAQEALAIWIVPNSGISDGDLINKLLHILDNVELVRAMNNIEGDGWEAGDKFTAPDTGDKIYTVSKVCKYDVEAADSRSMSGYTAFTKSYITKVN